jgi:hypothetical protein
LKVNVLGTEYEIVELPADQLKGMAGETDFYTKEIRLSDLSDTCIKSMTVNIEAFKRDSLKHEIIHAFLFESGLDMQSGDTESWAQNETMVDWIALQFPKIFKAFQDADCL